MKLHNVFIAGLAFIPLAGFAVEDLSYTWVELDYVNLDIEDYDENGDFFDDLDDGDGFSIRGSYDLELNPFGFEDTWFIFGNYTEVEADVDFVDDAGIFVPADTDVVRLDLGAGVAIPVNQMSQAVVRLGYSDIDVDGFNLGGTTSASIGDLGDDSSDGFFLDGSWRAQVAPTIEVSAGLRYTDIEDTDDVSFIGNALFEINDQWGVNLFADVGSDITQLGVGGRYTF